MSDGDARDRWMFRAVATLAALPIPIATIRNGLEGWFPSRDAGVTAVWASDVFTADSPLLSLPSRVSSTPGVDVHLLGPIHLQVLALPMELFGTTWGIVIAMGLLNLGAFAVAMWLIRRRLGPRLALLGCAVGAALLWTLGSQSLIDPTPVSTGAVLFFALCVAAWSVADGDEPAFIPLAVIANHLFLTHPKYILVVPALVATSTVMWWLRHRRIAAPAAQRRRRRIPRPGPVFWWVAATTTLLWFAPLYEQFARPGGNLRAWAAHIMGGSVESHRPVVESVLVASTTVATPPFWLRDSLMHPNFNGRGLQTSASLAAIGILIVVALGVLVVRDARRRGDRVVTSGAAIALVCWIALCATTWKAPDHRYILSYLMDIWPMAAFLWLVLAVGAVRSSWSTIRVGSAVPRRIARGAVIGATLVLVVVSIPLSGGADADFRERLETTEVIRDAIDDGVEPGGPVLVLSPSHPSRSYLSTVVRTLDEAGIEARVPGGWDTKVYRPNRRFRAEEPGATRMLQLLNGLPADMEDRRILAGTCPGIDLQIDDAFVRRRGEVPEWARDPENMRVADPAAFDEESTRLTNEILRAVHAENLEQDRTIFEDPRMVALFAGASSAELASILSVPGIEPDELSDLVIVQQEMTRRRCWFLVGGPV